MKARRLARKAGLVFAALVAIVVAALAFGAPVPIGEAFVLYPR